jgi:hypothetical protein
LPTAKYGGTQRTVPAVFAQGDNAPRRGEVAITDKGVWTGITSKGVTTGTTARGLTEITAPGLTTMTTNREDSRDKLPRAIGEDADLRPREFDLGSEQSVFVMLQAPSAELIAGQTRAPAAKSLGPATFGAEVNPLIAPGPNFHAQTALLDS